MTTASTPTTLPGPGFDVDAPPLSLQQLAAAAERLAARTQGTIHDWLLLVDGARDRLVHRPFRACAALGWHATVGGRERAFARATDEDRLIEEAALPVLADALEARLSDAAHGYRTGRSAWTAASAAADLIRLGHVHVACADIADFFPSVEWAHLERRVRTLLPVPLADVVVALATAPVVEGGRLVARERGLVLGRALSPALSNVALLDVDSAMRDGAVGYLRYADDVLLATRDEAALDTALVRLRDALAAEGLRLRDDKTRRADVRRAPVEWLGFHVDVKGVYERVQDGKLARILERASARRERAADDPAGDAESAPETRESRVVYVTEPGLYLSTTLGAVVVRRRDEVVREIPFDRIDRIVVLAGIAMSSGFAAACIQREIPVVFFVAKGRAFGSLLASSSLNPLRLRAQYDLVGNPARRVLLGREVVEAKLDAMLAKMRRRSADHDLVATVAEIRRGLPDLTHDDALRGAEGAATRAYYRAFASWIRSPAFAFAGRSRRPPRDPVNSALSLTYSLLFAEMQLALVAHGMDPHPGLLHALHRSHPALASDLIEPYRVLVADPFVLMLVNSGRVTEHDFEVRPGGAVYYRSGSLRKHLDAWEDYLHRRAGPATPLTVRGLVETAARRMLAVVLGESAALRLPLSPGEIGDADEPATSAPDAGAGR
jgi:CRISPR-associated protein Cas1